MTLNIGFRLCMNWHSILSVEKNCFWFCIDGNWFCWAKYVHFLYNRLYYRLELVTIHTYILDDGVSSISELKFRLPCYLNVYVIYHDSSTKFPVVLDLTLTLVNSCFRLFCVWENLFGLNRYKGDGSPNRLNRECLYSLDSRVSQGKA